MSCRIFAGYNKCIRLFDLHRPGRDFELYSTVKDKKEGQTGNFQIRAVDFFFEGEGGLAVAMMSIKYISSEKILWFKRMHIIQLILMQVLYLLWLFLHFLLGC